jgi:hypothetical protein
MTLLKPIESFNDEQHKD